MVKFWGLDPKRVELAIAPKWWDHYACRAKEMIELLEEAVEDMYRRAENLAGIARKFTPSTEMPLNVIIVDELAYLSVSNMMPVEICEYPDSQKIGAYGGDLLHMTRAGEALDYWVDEA